MKLWTYFKEHTGRDLKARIYAEEKQVACFTLGQMHPEILELAESEILETEGPDQHGYIDIYVDGKAPAAE